MNFQTDSLCRYSGIHKVEKECREKDMFMEEDWCTC